MAASGSRNSGNKNKKQSTTTASKNKRSNSIDSSTSSKSSKSRMAGAAATGTGVNATTTTASRPRKRTRRSGSGSSSPLQQQQTQSNTKTTATKQKQAKQKKQPQKKKQQQQPLPLPVLTGPVPTLVLDTGGWTVKHGIIHPSDLTPLSSSIQQQQPNSSPNMIAKPKHQLTTLISNEIHSVKNKAQLTFTYPLERGYTTDLGTQFQIWGHVLDRENINCRHSHSGGGVEGVLLLHNDTVTGKKKGGRLSPSPHPPSSPSSDAMSMGQSYMTHACAVVLLHQPFTPRCALEREDEVWFRDFGFGKVGRRIGACCSASRYLSLLEQPGVGSGGSAVVVEKNRVVDDGTGCCCVVDSGFSLTHVVPTEDGRAIEKAIRRINIGGKLLTNLLKETISYRQWNMMDEFSIVNEAKEALCFVSTNFRKEIKEARKVKQGRRWFDREFVLPDFTDTFQGSVRLPPALRREMDLKLVEEEVAEATAAATLKSTSDGGNKENDSGTKNDDDGVNNNDGKNKQGNKPEKEDSDGDNDDDDDDDEDGNDSDQETEEQMRRRIQKQREEERRRRELEEQERQVLSLSVERFAVPEVLFNPSDVGLVQAGLAEAIVQSINACDPIHRAAMYHNIVLTGGNVNIPKLKERLEIEIRALAPNNYKVRIHMPDDPVNYAWLGAQDLLKQKGFLSTGCLDRMEWEEKKKAGVDASQIWGAIDQKYSPDGFVTV